MGASWLEVEKLIREIDTLTGVPHAEALPAVTRARDMVAETAMVVSLAGVSDDPQAEVGAHDLLARARVAILEAQVAVKRATEAVAASRAGRARAQALISEARALRARDRSRAVISAGRAPDTLLKPVTALARVPEPAAS
jgi:fatty acid/phospholipid biosynthesis enzyme